MSKQQERGPRRICRAFWYSLRGIRTGLVSEASLRQETLLAAVLTAAACFLAAGPCEFVLLVCFPWLTVSAELLNSALEAAVDRVGTEYNELAGRAKDLGSAAVLVLLCLTALVWLTLLAGRFD